MDQLKKLEILIKLIFDKRFRLDKKAFDYSKPLFLNLAWDLLERHSVISLLKNGMSIDKIIENAKIKNRKMLECILDNLVGDKALNYRNGKYYLSGIDPSQYEQTHKLFLEKYYPGSIRWVNFVYTRADKALISGKAPKETGFDSEYLDLWDAIMLESPYSFRGFTIEKLLKNLKPGSKILDFGCGGGVGLRQFIELANKPVYLYGADISSKYLRRAKNKIRNFHNPNVLGIKLLNKNIDQLLRMGKKFDAVFLSLVLNHVKEADRGPFLFKIKKLLKPEGYLALYQIINQSKFSRSPIWIMHIVPSHTEYPFKDAYLKILEDLFSKVDSYLMGNVVIAKV